MHKRTVFISFHLFLLILLSHLQSIISLYTPHTSSILGPSDHREAYFNGSSYIRLLTTISLQKHTGLSFRTCIGGGLFSQQHNDTIIAVSVTQNGIEFVAEIAKKRYETKILGHFLDNRWHTVNLEYRLGNLTLSVSGQKQLIANKTFNNELLVNPGLFNDDAILIVGMQFSGCILEGPSIVFNTSFINPHGTYFGPCPIPTNNCVPRLDQVQIRREDHCYHEPCMRHGICVSGPDRYECHCSSRYSGNNCELDNGSPCKREPPLCLNGAKCIEDKQGDYKCVCIQGYTGKHCESKIQVHPLCEPNRCMNNGTCRVPHGVTIPTCVCPAGFAGHLCEIDVDECQSSPCENGGTCIDGPNNYTCYCAHTGYEGTNCEININECISNPCLNQGVCFDTYGSYVCHCLEGYDGQNCEQNLNECVSMPCQNRGTCVDKMGGYECLCPSGYSGFNCELSICDGTACPPYAECKEYKSTFRCVCKPGFSGIYPNCTEGGVCVHSPCLNGGLCAPHLDTFNCTCPPGFTGNLCERNSFCLSQPCNHGATCVEDELNYKCLCPNGFAGDYCDRFAQCVDNPCLHALHCQDFMGGYYCTCAAGWIGDECDIPSDRCFSGPCAHGATCISALHRHFCRCPPGYTGKHCQINIDECTSMPCLNGGTCIDKVNEFYCNCTSDYMGVFCEKPFDVCELKLCKNNATCINLSKSDFTCACLPGFNGKHCENNIDECLHITCPEGQVCVDLIAGYECRCPEGYKGENCSLPMDPCSKVFCQNQGTCIPNKLGYGFTCACKSGFTGRYCEEDIDECTVATEPLCNHGICVNNHGSFQCYCMPGYTDSNCSVDFDECLSQPCKNGATCLNKINNYECVCPSGYSGKDCNININECEASPCRHGGTCVDGIATFTCICLPGLTGRLCHLNIDDCMSSPCQHNGHCIDGLNNYTCDCTDTGYEGPHCDFNIDDCASNPCVNGVQCIDGVKDYVCNCYAGYTGKNCEIDINECESSPCQYSGTCLERSNIQLYHISSSSPIANSTLPSIFSEPFSYDNASGYECICIPGVTGKDCEININECDSSPCQKGGTCRDIIGGYYCECEEGVEGDHCEYDIDECKRYTPCVYGTCVDLKANYFCNCAANYGGKNCSVRLIGCLENPCANNGTCNPYLENEIHHKFNCSCTNGYHGETCEKITTMSLSGSSFIVVNTTRDEGYEIHFRFKTTLGDGLLAIGKGLTYYILELVGGQLNLHSSLLNKWEGVFVGSNLNNSQWQYIFVAMNSSHVVLTANQVQTIYPININEGSNSSYTSFPTTYLGGTISELRRLTHGPPAFVGCTEDISINGQWVLPENTSWTSVVDVEAKCSRTPQCNPNPCHSEGKCTDKWRTFSCSCERPFLGHTCQYNYTAATFGYENITNSLVTVAVADTARRAVRSIVDISMFMRTRQSAGQIFYIGSTMSGTNHNDDTYISAELSAGELLVRILFNGASEPYTVSGVKLDNGFKHLIEVIRNVTLVQVKLNGTEYFRKTFYATGQLDAQIMYLGGLPEISRSVRQTENSGIKMDTTTPSQALAANIAPSGVSFKGIIQDVQISNGSRQMVVEFFALDVIDLEIPPAFGYVTFDPATLKKGVVSDNLCRNNPCYHNGSCTVTWNDFRCDCPRGFKGKTCSDLEFCQLKDCPSGSQCRNLENDYECIANSTFDGKTKPLKYILEVDDPDRPVTFETIEINYRTRTGGTVMFAERETDYFFIFVSKDDVTVQWSLYGKPESYRFNKDNSNADWNVLYFIVKDRSFSGGFKESVIDDTPNFVANDFNVTSFNDLFAKGTIYLGGSGRKSYDFLNMHSQYKKYNTTGYITSNNITESNTVDIPVNTLTTELPIVDVRDKFKGCLGEIRVGNLLLPYYMNAEIYSANHSSESYFSLQAGSEHSIGCRLCYDEDCLNNGKCFDADSSYQCNCAPGYTAEDCSIDIDECQENKCQNNSTCVDGNANFTCICTNGYEGWLCDIEIDECQSNPCRNGGMCVDKLANYECVCTEDYVGRQCEALRLITCDNEPCRNGSTCVDGANAKTGNNFTCNCMRGMVGALCDTPFCIAEPCKHGICNDSTPEPVCQCERGYAGLYCEEDINDCLLPNGDSPCQHDAQCIDGVDKYTCNCSGTGYKGVICEIDVDECEAEYICGKNGKCENSPGSYRCVCPDGMCGKYCLLQDPCQTDPCGEHGVCNSICETEPLFICECDRGYYGASCNETVVAHSATDDTVNIALIVIPIVACVLLACAAGLAVLVAMARSKRATRGTYSPSAQEFCNPRVELDHVLKPPPEERLI